MELEQLKPVADDDLERAADLLTNFQMHWKRLEGDEEGRHELIKLIVERIYIQDDHVVAMTLRSNYHLVLNHKTNKPTFYEVDPFSYMDGSDELRSLICIISWAVVFLPKHIVKSYFARSNSSSVILPTLSQNSIDC